MVQAWDAHFPLMFMLDWKDDLSLGMFLLMFRLYSGMSVTDQLRAGLPGVHGTDTVFDLRKKKEIHCFMCIFLQLLSKHYHGVLWSTWVSSEDCIPGKASVWKVSSKQDMQPEVQYLHIYSLGKELVAIFSKTHLHLCVAFVRVWGYVWLSYFEDLSHCLFSS